jgi:NADH-quinone oxidoreductase subunit J
MTAEQILFLVAGVLLLVSAVCVVTTRNLLHAALWLVAALFGVAVLFALLRANFLVVVQIVVYIGAIAILFIFAVMLTRRELRDTGRQTRKSWWLVALIVVFISVGLVLVAFGIPDAGRLPAEMPQDLDTVSRLGESLVTGQEYLLPFEVASVLLLAALVGAVYAASTSSKKD